MFASHDRQMEKAITSGAMMLKTLGRMRSLRRLLSWLACMYSRHSRQYRREERIELHRQLMSVPWPIVAGIYEGVARAVPAQADRLERCAIVVGKDDPVAPEERVIEVLRRLDFPNRHIHRLVSGGHMPYAIDEDNPGWTMQNADHLARIVESMLSSSREGSPLTTAVESTSMATEEP
jgi:hypothetical protein